MDQVVPELNEVLAATPYRVTAEVARGGMGELVEAEHRVLGYRVVLKLLPNEHFANVHLKNRMRLEAHACMHVRHEHLVRVLEAGETRDGRTFIVMERLYGRSLREELGLRGYVPVSETLVFVQQALLGLAAAHAAGIVHRDLKPENLFLCEQPDGSRRLKVLDFGVAKIVEAGTATLANAPRVTTTADGLVMGTPRYTSPEHYAGERDLDARADVYSMGWVLYELITGFRPFHNRLSLPELARAHAREKPSPPSALAPQRVPSELDSAFAKAAAKRRQARFESADAFREELERIARELG